MLVVLLLELFVRHSILQNVNKPSEGGVITRIMDRMSQLGTGLFGRQW